MILQVNLDITIYNSTTLSFYELKKGDYFMFAEATITEAPNTIYKYMLFRKMSKIHYSPAIGNAVNIFPLYKREYKILFSVKVDTPTLYTYTTEN